MINDQFTNLKVSRQRKWQLRNPEAFKILKDRYEKSAKGKYVLQICRKNWRSKLDNRIYNREYQRWLFNYFRRYLNAKSYQDERGLIL